MRFEVFKKREEDKNLARLRLGDDGDGEVTLYLVDENDDDLYEVMRFKVDGTVQLIDGMDQDDVPFKVDDDGCIVIED